jgi:patatin-like phospholipase/acyl hydrolase
MALPMLVPGQLPKIERTAATPKHLLALAGGGFRGLFTARVLAQMEAAASVKLATRFDLMAGTSIGGILAIGIACGISAADLVALMREHGPQIFRPNRTSFGGFVSSRYDSSVLHGAIEKIVGKEFAKRPFAEIPAALIVIAVTERTSEPRIFRTNKAAPGKGDTLSTIDVALATSAAPTFFAPHFVGDDAYVDGGLVANAPDLVLIGEAMRAFGARLDDIHLCSIGTASSARVGTVAGQPGKWGWVKRHSLIELIMDAQAALAADQVDCLGPASILRIDRRPPRRITLDDVAPATVIELLNLADQAVATAQTDDVIAWRRMLAHSASPVP